MNPPKSTPPSTSPIEGQQIAESTQAAYWSIAPEKLLSSLKASDKGLTQAEADRRLKQYGQNAITAQKQTTALRLLLKQFKSPLVLILIVAAIISAIVGEWVDASLVIAIVLGSTILGFVQEYTAGNAVEKLRAQVTVKSNLLRDGKPQMLPSELTVPGDVAILSAGNLIPADGIVLEANDFFVNQAVLTGETFQVEKMPAPVAANASLAERTNSVFMGTSVGSGTAKVLIVETGKSTVFGQVAEHLELRPPETEFERGIRQFGNLLTYFMLVMVVIVLAVNVFLAKPVLDSLLFALALAVGLTPELLPAIISITLSYGAQHMAKRGVIVRRLNAIENLGSMDTLCTDKTGTLTQGIVSLDNANDTQGQPSDAILRYAYLNAHYQTGLSNPLDDAIQDAAKKAGVDISGDQKVDEIPYDFIRKRLSVVTSDAKGNHTLITKGALANILSVCTTVQSGEKTHPLTTKSKADIEKRFSDWSEKGFRVLGLATKPIEVRTGVYSSADEKGLNFDGFLLFFDPPKPDVAQVIVDLAKRGVEIKDHHRRQPKGCPACC